MTEVKDTARPAPDTLIRAGSWLCLAGASLGVMGLAGWISGAGLLTTLVPGMPAMMPATALALALIGAAGALRRRDEQRSARKTLSLLAALVVLAVGAGTLAEYALGMDLLNGLVQATTSPSRSSPVSALALTCLAAALLLFDVGATARVRPAEWLVLFAALAAFTGLTGIILGAAPLYRLTGTPAIGLSLLSAVSLLLTSMGLLLARPATGVMRVATSAGPGGILLRRLALPAIMAPLLLGFVVTRISPARGIVEVSVPVAILAAAMTGVSLALLVLTAAPLNRAHEDVEASRTQTLILVEQAPDGIFLADTDGRYTDVNDAGCRMLQYSRAEIVGKTIVDLIPPEDVERLWQSRAALLEGATDVAEWRLRRKDGSYVPVEVSARILPDGRWQGFVRDISERYRLERELRLSEARSTGILTVSADGIISIDGDQRITLFNEGAERMFGYSRKEAIGARLDMLLPERLRAVHHRHVASFATTPGIAKKMGAREPGIIGLRKNGEEFPVDAAISNLEVGGTRVLTVVVRDVTDQKRIEYEQRFLAQVGPVLATTLDYEETLSRIAEIATQGLSDFCIVDLVDEEGEVRRLRVVSRDPSKLWICDVLQEVPLDRGRQHLVRSALESGEPVIVPRLSPNDLEALSRDDVHLKALRAAELQSAMVIPLVASERFLGAISFLSTASSRVYGPDDLRLARELAQRASLAVDNARLYRSAQRAIQARDEVLGIVAHDLRNPLSMILIEARLLRRGGPEPEHRSREAAEVIQRAATRMNRLIQDLLDVTRIEAHQLTMEPVRLPAAKVASDAVALQGGLASSRSLELRLDLAPELPDVWADQDRLLQVFDNLIGNAVKFSAPGGRITVGAAPRDTHVLFWVSDTGTGLAIEDQPHLFDRFWQARRAGRDGAGLGLPIVKGIVEAHRGRIWVESVPGQGATFFFTIPSAQTIEQIPDSPVPPFTSGGGALDPRHAGNRGIQPSGPAAGSHS